MSASGGNRNSQQNPVITYTLLGFCFGLIFPVVALFINTVEHNLPISGAMIAQVHSLSTVQWVVDSAPVILAAFAYLVGKRQQRVLDLNRQQARLLAERETVIEELQETTTQREEEIQRSLTQLSTAAQITQLSTRLSPDRLTTAVSEILAETLNNSVRLISAQFGFYHVGIFITDSAYMPAGIGNLLESSTTRGSSYARLIASNSEGGQRMLARGHQLKVGGLGVGEGIVGSVAAKGIAKIALDVGTEAVYFDNPDLPETRSEMALPLIVAGKTVGVLDIQSTEASAFGERELKVMSLIADSLASTMENARLITELRSSLEEVRQLQRQYLQQTWKEAIELRDSVEYSTAQGGFLSTLPRKDAQMSEPQTGSLSVNNLETQASIGAKPLSVPIRLRGQAIGEITLFTEDGAQGTGVELLPEEVSLVETIADQAAQALENARLLEETQRRAERERITANIAGKVWSYSDIETILQTALLELGENLDATEGLIQLKSVGKE